MDPITFGMVFVGATGGTLLLLAGFNINETAVKITMECLKTGTILYFFQYIFKLFL